MGASNTKPPKWKEVGVSTTTPTQNKQRKEVRLDEYYVVVGFEVNKTAAFVNETQDLGVDFGHAFFYLVKNNTLTHLLSFGPTEIGKVGWLDKGRENSTYNIGALIKDGSKNARKGTPDYGITEQIKAFKVPITIGQAKKLEMETASMRAKILSGKVKYTAYLNDTCAETSRDVLGAAGIETPSGSGAVKHSGLINWPVAYAVNPYMWHSNFKKAGNKEVTYEPPGIYDDQEWLPLIGKGDPIFKAG